MEKTKRTLLCTFYLIMFLFPFVFGSFYSFRYFSKHYYSTHAFLITFPIFIIISIISNLKLNNSRSSIFWQLLVLVWITVGIRLFSVLIFKTRPTSDFGMALTNAVKYQSGPFDNISNAWFPYWGFYSILLAKIFTIFGSTLQVVKILNLVLSALTVIGIYFLGKIITNKFNLGLTAATIYAFFPADIIYKNLSTGEHIFTFLFPIVCILFIIAHDLGHQKKFLGAYSLITIAGIILGFMDLLKPLAIVVVIAIVICLLFFLRRIDFYQKAILKTIVHNTLFLTFLLSSFLVTKSICLRTVEKMVLNPLNEANQLMTIRVGLDPEHDGRFNTNTVLAIKELLVIHGEDYDTVNKILLNDIKNMIRENSSEIPPLLIRKFEYFWMSDNQIFRWATEENTDNSFDRRILGAIIKPTMDFYLSMVLMMSAIGAAYHFFRVKEMPVLLINLFIFGFALLLMITEIQQRYRSVMIPALTIQSSYGFIFLRNSFIKLSNHLSLFITKKIKKS